MVGRTQKMKGHLGTKQDALLRGVLPWVLLLGLLARVSTVHAAERIDEWSPYDFNFTLGDKDDVSLTFRENTVFVLTVNQSNYIGKVELDSGDKDIFTLKDGVVVFEITENTTFPYRMNVELRGGMIGSSKLVAYAAGDSSGDRMVLGTDIVKVQTPFRILGTVATYILATWLVISYVIMAAKVEPKVLLEKIKPPWGIIMGMVCQFVLMPPLAFGLAKVFDLQGAIAIGLVLVGTCPGGFFSNIEVLLLDCDIVLSLTMTTFSTFLAVGMMPLNLLIYAQPFVSGNGHLETPFKSLLIQLCGLVLPLLIGVPFFHRFQKARQVCLKLVKPFTFILMLLGVVLFIPSQYYIFFGNWKTWTTSAVLPLIGAFLGMSIARIANFNYVFSITVAIETGCQNTLLAVSVAKLFYKEPEADIVAIIPLLIAMVTGFEGIAIAAVYVLGRYIRNRTRGEKELAGNVEGGRDSPGSDAEGNPSRGAVNEGLDSRDEPPSGPRFRQLIPTDQVYDDGVCIWPPAPEALMSPSPPSPQQQHQQPAEEANASDPPPGETPQRPHENLPVGALTTTDDMTCQSNGYVIGQHAWL
ncbi:ileal sodium/bile acid cotransporter-like [Patiria miniata]|uniref:Ileal sodium/bile acid cotransporter n=1 Tax=Patiria miniata TaxID=46514 RepID=A0A914AZU5_PATMI|nr:ileal sodium/bile acid cotransporter-like [Patiria miniata]